MSEHKQKKTTSTKSKTDFGRQVDSMQDVLQRVEMYGNKLSDQIHNIKRLVRTNQNVVAQLRANEKTLKSLIEERRRPDQSAIKPSIKPNGAVKAVHNGNGACEQGPGKQLLKTKSVRGVNGSSEERALARLLGVKTKPVLNENGALERRASKQLLGPRTKSVLSENGCCEKRASTQHLGATIKSVWQENGACERRASAQLLGVRKRMNSIDQEMERLRAPRSCFPIKRSPHREACKAATFEEICWTQCKPTTEGYLPQKEAKAAGCSTDVSWDRQALYKSLQIDLDNRQRGGRDAPAPASLYSLDVDLVRHQKLIERDCLDLYCQCQTLAKPMETFSMDLDLDLDVASASGGAVSQYELSYGDHMDTYNVETSAVHRKLQSKVEALRILRLELEQFRVERDQYKLMAETLQLRYSALKHNSELVTVGGNGCGPLSQNSSLAALLHETREQNLKLNTEVEGLKQRLNEIQGDMELLRETEASNKARVQAMASENAARNKEELQWRRERANFICHLENLKKKNAQLAFDFKAIIDEKEELITERDAYKCKAHRLNHELFVALRAKKTHPKLLDIDGVLLENKYLHERVKIQEGELDLTKQSISKYKSMLDAKRKKGIVKLGGGTSANDETILSPRQVKTILESGIDLPQKTETIHDLKSLCLALLDNLNDKNLALTHQKKTNKILAGKMTDLEQRWQQLLAGDADSADADQEDDDDYGYAPSQLLLNGYCAAMVDDIDISSIPSSAPDNAGGTLTPEPEEHNKHKPSDCNGIETLQHSDDGMSSLSAESVDSSVYEVDVQREDFHKSSSATTDSGNCGFGTRSNGTPRISSAVARERMEDLKDLPPHLATLVQKALHELDLRDYEALVTIRAENVASIIH
ncbi:uncharacterized protein LOC6587654 isoform X1 [Drosophila persimilis]|uniref:uncharacterized protein LOC6587654 isoform X1 n=2 Tax=Drosophila persimilis TaxID=7234 RepID=UPI000F081164|nr:uncharacterized protein LOC6587654 isoform X1 [Drosophila persimilis]